LEDHLRAYRFKKPLPKSKLKPALGMLSLEGAGLANLLWTKKMLHKTAQEQGRGIHKAHLKPILNIGSELVRARISKSSSGLVKMLDDRIESINTNKASNILEEQERPHKPLFHSEPQYKRKAELIPDEQQ
jgi:hypothetical protein